MLISELELVWREFRSNPSRCRIEIPRPYRAIRHSMLSVRAERVLDSSRHANERNSVSELVGTEHAKYICNTLGLPRRRLATRDDPGVIFVPGS